MRKLTTAFVLVGAFVTVFLMVTFWSFLDQFMNKGMLTIFGS
jgi:hypothetical protein